MADITTGGGKGGNSGGGSGGIAGGGGGGNSVNRGGNGGVGGGGGGTSGSFKGDKGGSSGDFSGGNGGPSAGGSGSDGIGDAATAAAAAGDGFIIGGGGGGTSGNTPTINGTNGNQGGGGGGVGRLYFQGSVITIDADVTGGNGGSGGSGGSGVFLYDNRTLTLAVDRSIIGGSGSRGSANFNSGDGGDGLRANKSTVTNNGTIKGGDGGSGGGTPTGKSGVGILANGTIIMNNANATIQGGNAAVAVTNKEGTNEYGAVHLINAGQINKGSSATKAVELFGSGNKVELHNGFIFNGDVVVSAALGSTNTLILGGRAANAFDVTRIGTTETNKFTGFTNYETAGTATWTLTGSSTGIKWDLKAGTLKLGDTNSAYISNRNIFDFSENNQTLILTNTDQVGTTAFIDTINNFGADDKISLTALDYNTNLEANYNPSTKDLIIKNKDSGAITFLIDNFNTTGVNFGLSEDKTNGGTLLHFNALSIGTITISGEAKQGAILTADGGSAITDADGRTTTPGGAYQWQRSDNNGNWTDITNATGTTYTLVQGDVGSAIRVKYVYTDDAGVRETVVSTQTATIASKEGSTSPTEPTIPTDPSTPTDPTMPTDPSTPTEPSPPAEPGSNYTHDVFNAPEGDTVLTFNKNLSSYTLEYKGGYVSIQAKYAFADDLVGYTKLVFADGSIDLTTHSGLFDPVFYALQNLDVFKSGAGSWDHFQHFGNVEGRDPNPFFDIGGYLAVNKDVAAAGVNALEHFIQYGVQEGRDTSTHFDMRLYLQHNPDVEAAGVNPLEHYLVFGRAEGRVIYDAIGDTIATDSFDEQHYLLDNADVAAAGVDARAHFTQFGFTEGRSANSLFEPAEYLARNADVAAAGVDPLTHYNEFGWREGRAASSHFDTQTYLAENPDVTAADINPLTHYLQFGIFEGRPIDDAHVA